MDKLKRHHSTTDWDFNPSAYYYLAYYIYVSAPTSLYTQRSAGYSEYAWFFLKAAVHNCIRDGKFITYMRTHLPDQGSTIVLFRVQALPADGYPDDCYRINISYDKISLIERAAAADTTLAEVALSPTLSADTWYQVEVRWWSWRFSDTEIRMRVRVYIYEYSQTVPLLDCDVSNALFYDSAVNKAGGMASLVSLQVPQFWYDDTRVYIRNPMPDV